MKMKRMLGVLGVAALLLALAAGAALAANSQRIQCNSVPCYATGNDDLVLERIGNGKNDQIHLQGGDDKVKANKYGNDTDVIYGGSGFDAIYVNDGDNRDTANGGAGANDLCVVDSRSEVGQGCSKVIVD